MTAYAENPFDAAMRDEEPNEPNPFAVGASAASAQPSRPESVQSAVTQTVQTGEVAGQTGSTSNTSNTANTANTANSRDTTKYYEDGDCCPSYCPCLARIPPKIIAWTLFAVAQALTIGAVIIDELDYCLIDSSLVNGEQWLGMFTTRIDITVTLSYGSFDLESDYDETEDYADLCEEYDDVTCDWSVRGIFYIIFLIFNWMLMIYIVVLYFVKEIPCCFDLRCKSSLTGVLFGICGVLMAIALTIWDANNGEYDTVVAGDCELHFFGWSNVCMFLAIIIALSSSLFTCTCGSGAFSQEA